MKTLIKTFLKNYAIFSAFFLLSIPATAQVEQILEDPYFPFDRAIVRYWQDNQYVVYSEDGSYSYFSLIDYPAMTRVTFRTRVLGVNDFEIDDKTVYFCGNESTGPVFGFFEIPTLFSSGVGMYTIGMGGWYSSQERITDLTKLVVQKCNDGEHIYMVGKSEYLAPEGTRQTRCMVDMRHDYMGWYYDVAQEKDAIYYYDDITTVTAANKLVVIGHKNRANGHYATPYTLPASASVSLWTSSPYMATYYFAGGGYYCFDDPHRPLMIDSLPGGYYAVVAYTGLGYGSGIVDRGTVVYIYEPSYNTCVYRCFISQGFADTAYWELKDFRYNGSTEKLYLLQEMSNPVSTSLESVICAFNYNSSLHIITGANAYYIPSEHYLSLDQCENNMETVAVEGGVAMRLWHHNFGNNCIEKMPFNLFSPPPDNGMSYYYQYPVPGKGTPAPVEGKIESKELIIICE